MFYVPAALAYTDAGVKYTSGQDNYAGMSAFAEWGNEDYYLRPSLNTYKSDLADRYSAYSFSAGMDRDIWSFGAGVSVTPETGGYSNTSLYGDINFNLISTPPEDSLVQDAALGVFAVVTAHEDAYALSTATVSGTGRRGGDTVSALTDAFKLSQRDYGVYAAVKAYGLRASCTLTKTSYDKDVTAEARLLPLDISGIGASGFPDAAISARLRAYDIPLSPSAGYTKTTYLLDQPDSESFSLGLSIKTGPAELSAGWENLNPGGGLPRNDYYSLGVVFGF